MVLDEICAHKRQEVARRSIETPVEQLRDAIDASRTRPRDFRNALRAEGISLIAEVKRASPSRGALIENVDSVELGAVYEEGGARAISVLTDEKFFKGSLDDLTWVHQGVSLPCLRKDFVIDEYQVYEARAAQADAILLIVRILSDQQARDYLDLVRSLGMAALVEAHNEAEIERALEIGAHIIGINNRDLDTLDVDINTTIQLKKLVPGGHVLVSESGIHARDHVRMLEDGGIDAILVGEALVTSDDIQAKIRELLGRDES